MTTFVTHPSIRIKGTENNYTPVTCFDPNCPFKTQHMHCPFCVKTESYQDPVILKAHFRVKHVDKGLDFAGLKILRCCDHCDIVGAIKGEKKFKGAHWHCYKCRNGFNRRDEAIKHFKTHFRNPQTTFQIQITQEVNQMYTMQNENQQATERISMEDVTCTIHPVLTEAVMNTTAAENNLLANSGEATLTNGKDNTVHVAANETVGSTEGQTIMIIQSEEEQLDSGQSGIETYTVPQNENYVESDTSFNEKENDLLRQIEALKLQNEKLELEKSKSEQMLRNENEQLRIQLQLHSQQIAAYQKREQELLSQLSISLDERIQEILTSMQQQHQNLLHQQLAQLKRDYINGQSITTLQVLQESSHNSIQEQPSQTIDVSTTTTQANEVSLSTTQASDVVMVTQLPNAAGDSFIGTDFVVSADGNEVTVPNETESPPMTKRKRHT